MRTAGFVFIRVHSWFLSSFALSAPFRGQSSRGLLPRIDHFVLRRQPGCRPSAGRELPTGAPFFPKKKETPENPRSFSKWRSRTRIWLRLRRPKPLRFFPSAIHDDALVGCFANCASCPV